MVKKFDHIIHNTKFKNHIRADVIILGCSLPGIVTAHNLKRKFGTSMTIVVLDLATTRDAPMRDNVAFKTSESDTEGLNPEESTTEIVATNEFGARYYLDKCAQEFGIPRAIVLQVNPTLNKLFQYMNGHAVNCENNFYNFNYLSFIEKFELEQYHMMLDYSTHNLFHLSAGNTNADRKRLLYFDQTTMEDHLRGALLVPTSREIMRTIVRLTCGAPADQVSVLFYLHQCYRVRSSKNHIDGENVSFREKLLGGFQNRLTHTLQKSIQDITMQAKPIEKIRMSSEERVVLEPVIGETDYICNLLAMAVRPDQLNEIALTTDLLAERDATVMRAMRRGVATKFSVQYEDNFWRKNGYSGDILSIRGPILWATECPKISSTRETDKYATLIGYLAEGGKQKNDNREAVLNQLVMLFGKNAASPISYNEKPIEDVYVPRCGDYVALRKIKMDSPSFLEWSALDIFGEGDVAGAVEAGHTAYLHLLSILRPQAIAFDDVAACEWPISLVSTWDLMKSSINYISATKMIMYGVALAVSVHLIKNYLKKS